MQTTECVTTASIQFSVPTDFDNLALLLKIVALYSCAFYFNKALHYLHNVLNCSFLDVANLPTGTSKLEHHTSTFHLNPNVVCAAQ